MQISLTRPELEQFIKERVEAGDFSSPAEVVEAGLARLMLDPDLDELDSQDIVTIRKSLDQMRSGQVRDWKECSAELRKKYLSK